MSQCPFCADPVGAKGLLPEGENTCPVCGNEIGAAAAAPSSSAYQPAAREGWESTNRREAAAPSSSAYQPAVPGVTPRPRNLNNVADKPRTPAPPAETEQTSAFAGQLRKLDIGTAAAFALGSVGLLTASISGLEFLTKPLSGAGLLVGLVGGVVPAAMKHASLVLPGITCGLCLFVLLLVGDWPRVGAPAPRPAMVITLHKGGMVRPRPVEEDEWVDASSAAFRTSDIQVQVVSVQLGPVNLRVSEKNWQSPENYLTIRLRVTDEGVLFREKVPYETWADEAGAPSKHPPELMDNQERVYPQKTFDANTKIGGRPYADGLSPPAMTELLVFPAPQQGIEYLRLKLPGAAFGIAGEFRFQIPKSMIEGLE
jgi:hypothetical protein